MVRQKGLMSSKFCLKKAKKLQSVRLNLQARERAGLLGDKVEEIAQPSERTGELTSVLKFD